MQARSPEAHNNRRGFFTLALLVAALGVGCSSDDGSGASDSPTTTAMPVSVTDFSNACERLSGFHGAADYDPADSPTELADRSELVIEGTMERVVRGRLFRPGEPGAGYSVVMAVQVETVHKGDLPPDSSGRVYIESLPGPELAASDLDRVLPRDGTVLMYLSARVPPDGELPPVDDPSAGRPDGQPLWQLTLPQGFLVEFGGEGVVQIPECERYPGAELADFRPGRQEFPQATGTEEM